ncbi:MAG TPA: anaerobic ribonucleoside-triphosphate reductase activating protein [Candidatus Omnitrophota bacterium]|nr:anaerobic ribonucleoside-triphosphate reductase activating protein [Candidatus Omnitrophota bacterium]
MQIGGFLKCSLVDYPGKVAAVVFTQGCNFRCPFCHNPELVIPASFRTCVPETEVVGFLEQRRGVLQGLTVTGGEPTLQPDLSIFLKTVKNLGYSVKLDTNGSQPDVLAVLFQQNLVDYVAMDIKTSLPLYQKACGVDVDTACIGRSIDLLKTSGVDYAFRSTAVKPFIEERTLLDIQKVLNHPQRYILQEFILRDQLVAASLLDEKQYTPEEFKALKTKWDMAPGLTFSGRGNNSE